MPQSIKLPAVAKFVFDRTLALIALTLLFPGLVLIALWVALDSPGGAFFVQERVGRGGRTFGMWKFRTMRPLSEKSGKLTVGGRDPRITRAGFFLRKYKLDELPQLFNVLTADMSFVGPRPEVPEFAALYSEEQRRVLEVRPGITDYASLLYFHENELLAESDDPQSTYIREVMPAKLALNLDYIRRRSFAEDLRIIGKTVRRIFSR